MQQSHAASKQLGCHINPEPVPGVPAVCPQARLAADSCACSLLALPTCSPMLVPLSKARTSRAQGGRASAVPVCKPVTVLQGDVAARYRIRSPHHWPSHAPAPCQPVACPCRGTNHGGATKAFKCPKLDAPGGPDNKSARDEWHGRSAILERVVAAGQESLKANIVPLDRMHRVRTREFGDITVLEMRCDAMREGTPAACKGGIYCCSHFLSCLQARAVRL